MCCEPRAHQTFTNAMHHSTYTRSAHRSKQSPAAATAAAMDPLPSLTPTSTPAARPTAATNRRLLIGLPQQLACCTSSSTRKPCQTHGGSSTTFCITCSTHGLRLLRALTGQRSWHHRIQPGSRSGSSRVRPNQAASSSSNATTSTSSSSRCSGVQNNNTGSSHMFGYQQPLSQMPWTWMT